MVSKKGWMLRGYMNECISYNVIIKESNDEESGVNRAKMAYMSTRVALAMVGSALLIHLL